MVDERQTHQLPDDILERAKIANSLGFGIVSEEKTLASFDRQLDIHRKTARACFERVLPEA
jgi:glutamine synthetase adenylyltransferase